MDNSDPQKNTDQTTTLPIKNPSGENVEDILVTAIVIAVVELNVVERVTKLS